MPASPSFLRSFTFILGLIATGGVDAQSPVDADVVALEPVVVVGSRAPEPLQQVVGSVSIVERDQLERNGVLDIADLAALVPGVSVPVDAVRFGRQGFNIRGLEGNRVSIEIDGVPLPDGFGVGQFALAGRDLVALDAVQRVEVLRGPASTLYGSKALAGVVSFTTRAPEDFLWRGNPVAIGGSTGVASRDDSRFAAAALAAENQGWSGLFLASRVQGHEVENNPGQGGMPSNPADLAREAVLAKIVHDSGDAGLWTLTLDHGAGSQQTDVQSLVFGAGRYSTTYALDADDEWKRDRASLAASWSQPWVAIDAIDLLVYQQDSSTRQSTDQYRLADVLTPYPTLRAREFEYEQSSRGLELVAQSRTQWGEVLHWQVFGIDMARHDYEGLRTGTQFNLDSGQGSDVILGEAFPVRDFPTSKVQELGIFWQDEISFAPRWTVAPGLRWERYSLDAHADEIWSQDNPDSVPADLANTQWTPKLGLRFVASEHATFYLQGVRGYRAPPFSDVNVGLYLPTFNYLVKPNPDLKAERSYGLEAGMRWNSPALRASVAIYDNHFRDLIDSRANLGIDPASGALVFQSVNRDRARIQGIEAEAHWLPGLGRESLQGFYVDMRLNWLRGTDTVRDQPLNTITPGRATLVAGWQDKAERWGAQLSVTGVQPVSRIDTSNGPLYQPAGFSVVDLNTWVHLGDHVRLDLALRNLGDRRYWDWLSVRGLGPDSADLDLYTQPGRNFMLKISADW
ncbi:TonB-dependent hemoglobin/transferrin/lactoferrin family receptor [Dokdonella sp.]|uniref:TonB-dependent hemoglobin/transferrin/lactoferrin family receptor n=1 Tax=Dokdonella sp. TaxID=2291710 RepID=UPI003C65A809